MSGEFRWIGSGQYMHSVLEQAGKAAGALGKDGYIMVRVSHQGRSRLYPAHQIVWAMTRGDWPEREIDHRDNIRSNNDPDNLRIAARWQNMGNLKMHRDNRVGFKGVVEHQGGYRARILINGRMADLGVFSTPELAHAAYCRASEERGEFSRTE